MSFGFEVINDGGGVLIDHLYKNLRLVRRATSVKTPRQGSTEMEYAWKYCAETINVDCPTGYGLVAVRPGPYFVASNLRRDANGINGYLSPAYEQVLDGPGNRFEYCVFDSVGVTTDTGTFSMQVLDATGAVTFDARQVQLAIYDIVAVPDLTNFEVTYTVNHAYCPDAFYALETFSGFIGRTEDGAGGPWFLPMVRQISPTQVQMQFKEAGALSNIALGVYNSPSPRLIVCKPSV